MTTLLTRRGSMLARALIFSGLLSVAPLTVLAQAGDEPAPATDPSEDRAASFRVVDGAVSEDVPGGALLVGAYGAVLVLLLGYVLWLGSLQAGSNKEIARLGAALEKSANGGATAKTPKRDAGASKPKGEAAGKKADAVDATDTPADGPDAAD